MQIVIDIPNGLYANLSKIQRGSIASKRILDCVRNGKVLPKGHGRLIDADALKKYIDDCDCCVGCEDESYGCADKCKCPDYLDEGMERIINNQPTIIAADKSESEGME